MNDVDTVIEEIKDHADKLQVLALNYSHPDCPDVAEWHEVFSRGRDLEELVMELESYTKLPDVINKIKNGIEEATVMKDGSNKDDYWNGRKEALEYILRELYKK